ATLGVALLAVLDLVVAHRSLNPTAPRKLLTYRPATLDYVDQRDGSRLYTYDYYGVAGKRERYLTHGPMEELQALRESWPYPFAAGLRRVRSADRRRPRRPGDAPGPRVRRAARGGPGRGLACGTRSRLRGHGADRAAGRRPRADGRGPERAWVRGPRGRLRSGL